MVFVIDNIFIFISMVIINIFFLWLELKRDVIIKFKKFFMKFFKFILFEVFGVDVF